MGQVCVTAGDRRRPGREERGEEAEALSLEQRAAVQACLAKQGTRRGEL